MGRRTTIALACCCAALLATAAFGQGSVGGSLGKTDKSSSGGEEPTQRGPAQPSTSGAKSAASITGRWAWTQKCDDHTDFTGAFELTQNSDGTVSGKATGNDGDGSVSGKLVGSKLTGTRCYAMHCTQISFNLAGNSLDGSEKSLTHGMCRYQGRRH